MKKKVLYTTLLIACAALLPLWAEAFATSLQDDVTTRSVGFIVCLKPVDEFPITAGEYGEHEDLGTNINRYTERVLDYNANGSMKRFQRHGLKDDGVYGKIDNLHISLDGNRITAVSDDAAPVTRYASADFHDGDDGGTEYTYNSVGALTSDRNRGIASIEYDALNNPRRLTMDSGTLSHGT